MNSIEEIRKALKNTKIFIIPYAHCDWAWTHTRKWHRERYASIINSVLEILENYPQFRWYMDNYKMELTPFLEKYPEKVESLKEFVKEGKIGVCGGYANVRPNMVGEETFIRNLVIGRRYFKNLFPDVDLSVHADAVDVALGHPQMPQVLRKAGYKYFRCWRPHEVMTVKGIPNEFVWKGLDGSEILVSRGCYAGLGQKELAELDYKKGWEKTLSTLYELELEYILSTSKTKLLWVSHGMDDMLPLRTYPGREELPIDLIGIVEEWNRREETPMIFATPLEFYKALEDIKEMLPIVKGTIDPCDVCYNAAWNGEKGLWALRYKGDYALVEAEKWSTISSMFTGENTTYQDLWEDLLTASAHATQWLFEEDFQEIYLLASRVVSEGVSLRSKALRDVISHIDIPDNCSAVMFNSLSFKYNPLVKITIPVSNIDRVQLKDGNNNIIPFQVLKSYIWPEKVWEWDVLIRIDLPPLGYNIIKMEESEESHRLERSPRLDIKLEAGRVVEIIDNETKDTYKVSEDIPWNHLRYYGVDIEGGALHVGPITGCCDVQWYKYEVIEKGPLRWIYRVWGNIGVHNVVQDIILFDEEDRIEFLTEVDWKGGNGFLLAMIPLGSQGELLGDIPFGMERKPIESEPYGKLPGRGWDNIHRQREGMFFAKSFVIHKGKSYSTVFWSINGDRYFIYNKKTNTLGHILINSIVRPLGTWEEHVNSSIEGVGRHQFSYSIKVSRSEIDESETIKTSLKLRNNPVVLDPQRGLDKTLPPFYSFLSLIPEDIVISAIYREGEDIIIRLFEPVGKKREVRLYTYFNFKEVFSEDFIGNRLEEPFIRLKDKEISFEIKPYEIVTLRGRLR
jgi:hypothetical protein